MKAHTKLLAAGTIAMVAVALAGCSGSSVEGTYRGSAGDTILILGPDGQCTYDDDWDEGDDLPELDEDCNWVVSDDVITLNNIPDLSADSLQGEIGSDGKINFPDQEGWNPEIYTKEG